jgi:hypothetical protein
VRQALVSRGELAIRERESSGSKQNRSFALRSADLSEFTADEIALVSNLIVENRDRGCSEVRNISEEIYGWQKAEEGESIPYEIAFISRRPPTKKERLRALQDVPRARAFFAEKDQAVLTDA